MAATPSVPNLTISPMLEPNLDNMPKIPLLVEKAPAPTTLMITIPLNPILPVQPTQPTIRPYQSAEVTGVVTKVTFPKTRNDPTAFRIHCPNIGKNFDAVCNLFCPIREGDTIYALCMIGPDGKLHISRQPFVQPAMDRDSIVQCFMRALRLGYQPTIRIYSTISKIAGGDDQVIPFLSGIAQSWNDTRNTEILFMFGNIDSDNVKKLLNWWHRERNLRRLYLFGLTKKEINACRMTCDEIYQRCMTNPYTIPAIPIDKCDGILDRLNKQPPLDERTRGAIVRIMWRNIHESGWTGTPTRFLARQFPNIREHVDALKAEYGLVAEMETAYLKFQHKVETWIAEYLINKRNQDVITYETPIDESVTLPDGRIVERVSAHFTREMSDEQQRAVQGALDHTLCIITGGAGVGKCLAIGTHILMSDGSIKKIEEIRMGEYVMGPDSKPRRVLSKCSGTDNMFEIIPKKGRSFVCNTPHVLTLKGFEPYIEERPERMKKYVVRHSIKGIRKSKAFSSQHEAQQFINSLSEDIFDIPLNEFMRRSEEQQRYSYLFHVGIEFPERELPIDPYLIGHWLGDGHSGGAKFTTVDPEILTEYGLELNPVGNNYRCSNKFACTLRHLNMLDNKHIPDLYKINSRQNRLRLLAGLIDSDGYNGGNWLEIVQKNKRLSDDIEYLAFSLGFMVTRIECTKGCMYKGEMRSGVYQRMNIFGEGLEEIPVLLERKRCDPRQQKKRAECLRFEIKPLGPGLYSGFELDGDGRFLLGDFLVTHNTTVLGQLIHNLELRGVTYAVCSFTGKAVARIREVTKKRNPSTMHRLISNTRKNHLDKRSTQFEKDIPLMEYEYAIIDEASMVTTELLYDFLQAYPNLKHLVLVGDANQLPPIGWGNLFSELVKSETVPTYRLTTNYRVYTTTGDRDGVILNANAMIAHDPRFPFEFIPTSNFSIIDGPIERVYDIIRGCFSAGIKPEQIVILSPYNRILDVLNKTFQDIYNVGARYAMDSRGVKWMIGDRVMLTENDQEIGVFNGEQGTIRDITNKAILVDFGQSGCHEFLLEPSHDDRANVPQGMAAPYWRRGRMAEQILDGDEGDIDDERTVKKLVHGYALSVDKSQGSEWDFVILCIQEFNTGAFLNKNRIYTAITRTKRCCWTVVSDIDAFQVTAVKPPPFRCENLAKRLSTRLPNLKPFHLQPQVQDLEMQNNLPIMLEDDIPADYFDTGFDEDDYE